MERVRDNYKGQVQNVKDIKNYGSSQIQAVREQYYEQVWMVLRSWTELKPNITLWVLLKLSVMSSLVESWNEISHKGVVYQRFWGTFQWLIMKNMLMFNILVNLFGPCNFLMEMIIILQEPDVNWAENYFLELFPRKCCDVFSGRLKI